MKTESKKKNTDDKENKPVFGNPVYSANDDIYSNDNKEELEEEEVEDSELDKDKDVPGAELDDTDEHIGEEDEENNFYSLGGDDHDNLDETEDE